MYRGTYLNEFLNLVNLLESICNVFEIIVEVIGEVIGKIIDQTFRLRLREITLVIRGSDNGLSGENALVRIF